MSARRWDTPEVRAAARERSAKLRARREAEVRRRRAETEATPETRRLASAVTDAYGERGRA
jgi:hypothetical protein